uniref:Uncharacterized protein n=1 Tax=Brassica campestris TaxID=3711 RepID=A0A3P6B6P1_BRACM|nr:unnamed protein product [Brassica rapa]
MVKALQTRLPPISRKKKRRGDIRAYISRGDLFRQTPRRGRIDPMRDSARGFELPAHSECDGSGVKFVHAAAKTVSVSDVLDRTMLTRLKVSESLLAVQVTELKDGVFIGYGVNHLVSDGTSFWSFFF